jgi:hypothetical protein
VLLSLILAREPISLGKPSGVYVVMFAAIEANRINLKSGVVVVFQEERVACARVVVVSSLEVVRQEKRGDLFSGLWLCFKPVILSSNERKPSIFSDVRERNVVDRTLHHQSGQLYSVRLPVAVYER